MDNNQTNNPELPAMPDNYYPVGNQPMNPNGQLVKPSNQKRNKFIIIGLIAAVIVAVIVLIAVLIIKNNQPSADEQGDVTATLQLYADLPDEMPISDVEKTVKELNANAQVTMDEGYGMIKIPDTNEFIAFSYEDSSANSDVTNEATSEEVIDAEDYGDDEEYIDEEIVVSYQPNTAHSFIYVYTVDDNDIFITKVGDELYQYYDGADIVEYPTKLEAIDAYLAPDEE